MPRPSQSGCYPKNAGRIIMSDRSLIGVVAGVAAIMLASALMMTTGGVRAADESKYPDWKGRWNTILTPGLGGQRIKFDPTKAWGPGQQAPLTPEYQKVLQDSMADPAVGGIGNYT